VSQLFMVQDPNPGYIYNRTGAEQMCEEPGSTKERRQYSLFNIDQCGIPQEADSDSTSDGDVKVVIKPQKQTSEELVNNTVRVHTIDKVLGLAFICFAIS